MTAKALRCDTRIELTVDESLQLDRIRHAGHAVPARLPCELEHEHRGAHVAFAQTGEGISSNAVFWMRWTATDRDVVELTPGLARDPDCPENQYKHHPVFCWLPTDHRGAHEWQLRSDLEFTRTTCSGGRPRTRRRSDRQAWSSPPATGTGPAASRRTSPRRPRLLAISPMPPTVVA